MAARLSTPAIRHTAPQPTKLVIRVQARQSPIVILAPMNLLSRLQLQHPRLRQQTRQHNSHTDADRYADTNGDTNTTAFQCYIWWTILLSERCHFSRNTDAAAGNCPAGSGADTITVTRNITAPNRFPAITSEVTINGGGFTISSSLQTTLFRVYGATANLTINSATLTSARKLLFVDDHGTLNINSVTLTGVRSDTEMIEVDESTLNVNNSAIQNNVVSESSLIDIDNSASTVTISNSTIQDNDARSVIIHNEGKLTISNSILRNNDDTVVYSRRSARLTVSSSTFSSNTEDNGTGGAIDNSLDDDSSAVITNSTFSGNQASTYGERSTTVRVFLTITNSTFNGNRASSGGGGIYKAGGTVNLRNSIIAGSTGGDCVGGLDQNINNLIKDNSCSPALSGDPQLGGLTGSPAYFPLLDGSPAIDAAHADYCPEIDQAGNIRPSGAGCDIGAHETSAAAATVTPTVTPTATDTATVEVTTETCVQVGEGKWYLFYEDNFLSGLVTIYPNESCFAAEITQEDIGANGYVHTTEGEDEAAALCTAGHDDGSTWGVVEHSYNDNVWVCEAMATSTPTATATPIPPATNTPTLTDTPAPTATDTPETPARCKTLMDGFTFLFPESYFLSGSAELYLDSHCQDANPSGIAIPDDGMVYTTDGRQRRQRCAKRATTTARNTAWRYRKLTGTSGLAIVWQVQRLRRIRQLPRTPRCRQQAIHLLRRRLTRRSRRQIAEPFTASLR